MTIVINFKKPVKYNSKQYVGFEVTQLTCFNNVLSIISGGNLKTFNLDIVRSIAIAEGKGGEDKCEVPQSD